jgi:hypothetical protein
MAKGIEIASTTDSQADIERAIGLEPSSQALNEERERMEAQAAPPPEQAPPPEPEQPKPPQKTKAEKRIDKLVFEREEARRETEALKARVAELETGQRNAMPPVSENGHSQPPTQEHLARVQEARGRYADWDSVMARARAQKATVPDDVWEAVQLAHNSADVTYFLAANDELRKQLNGLPPQHRANEIRRISADLGRSQGIIEDIQAFLAKKPDVKELNDRAPQLRPEIAGAVRQATMEAENPGELTYHLLAHPDIVRKLNQMTQRQAFIEATRESARLDLTSNGHSRPVSSAPAPIQPLRGTASTSTVDPDEMDYQDFKVWRERNKRVYGVRR